MKTKWSAGLEPRTRVMVEHIAVKYDAAWRSGWLSAESLWKNPYVEGMIEATAFMADEADEVDIRKAVAGYCAAHGYLPMSTERPDWLSDEMTKWWELWEQEEDAALTTRTGVVESRRKLQRTLRNRGFIIMGGPRATKQWVLVNEGAKVDGEPQTVYIEVRAHKDGSEANYTICNKNWLPIQ